VERFATNKLAWLLNTPLSSLALSDVAQDHNIFLELPINCCETVNSMMRKQWHSRLFILLDHCSGVLKKSSFR